MRILITGVTGQDGSNMADYLLQETNHEIYGTVRRLSVANHGNLTSALKCPRFHLVSMDLSDQMSVDNTIRELLPDYCINLAAQSFVGESWNSPILTFNVNAMGVLYLLEAIRKHKPSCRFYSAGSSEEFGDVLYSPQDLDHPIRPRSPYGASKASARHIVKVYRDSYKLFAIHSILFNHEGKRRGKEFVTRKITSGLVGIRKAMDQGEEYQPLRVGNIQAMRDWGDSEDFVKGIWLMLNQPQPDEYILATGETHSVKEFIDLACHYAGFKNLEWLGQGVDTVLTSSGRPIVVVDPAFYRPAEVDTLTGDASKAMKQLGWKPQVSFQQLVEKMVQHDLS